MPVLCDYAVIRDNNPVTIGDANPVFEAVFGAGGRESSPAFLLFNVNDLTHTNRAVAVKINGHVVGHIQPYFPNGADVNKNDPSDVNKERQRGHWYTQMIGFAGSYLISGNNTLRIEAVEFPGNSATNRHDDFSLKNVVCFYHQAT